MKCRGHPSTSVLAHCLHLFNNLVTFHSSADASSTPSGEGPEYFLAIQKAAATSFQGVFDHGTLGPWGQSLFVWFTVMSPEPNHTEHSVKSVLNEWTSGIWRYPGKVGVSKLQDLIPDDLRWSRCNNTRSKVYNKCNALESSQSHPSPWKTVFHETSPWCQKGWWPLP